MITTGHNSLIYELKCGVAQIFPHVTYIIYKFGCNQSILCKNILQKQSSDTSQGPSFHHNLKTRDSLQSQIRPCDTQKIYI